MLNIVWWEVESPFPEKFMAFHSKLHGWAFELAFRESELNSDYWIIKAGASSIGGLQRSAINAGPMAGTRIYFETENLESFLKQVVALGGTVERYRTALGGDDRWFATFADSCGISFGIWTSKERASDLPPSF